MKKETILIVDEKGTFRKGMRKLFELHFGKTFRISDLDYDEFLLYQPVDVKLIVTGENYSHEVLERYKCAKDRGCKLILLLMNTDNLALSYKGLSLYNGILLKNMLTSQLLKVVESILQNEDDVYIHPEIGYCLLQELLK